MIYYFMGKASKRKKVQKNVVGHDLENRGTVFSWPGLRSNSFLHVILISLIAFIIYSNTFNAPFHFDDRNIFKSRVVKDFDSSAVLRDAFENSRYIGYLSFALNYKINDRTVFGYHFFNIIIHILNALLVYSLVILTFRTPYLSNPLKEEYSKYIALFSALFFVSHPVQTQAVTYIVQRFASLATLFYLLSLVMYIKWRESRGQRAEGKEQRAMSNEQHAIRYTLYAVSLLSAIFAMKTKEISFTLPIIIVLYEFMFFKGDVKKRILCLIPFLLTMLIIPLALITTDKYAGDLTGGISEATRANTPVSRLDYLFTQFRVVVTYIRLLFFPVNQNLDYEYPIYHSFFEPNVFLSFIFLLSIFALGIYLLYAKRYTLNASRFLAFGIFWFFITLSVESGIIPITDVIFEHRVYLPSAGFFLALVSAVFLQADKSGYKKMRMVISSSLAIALIIFSIAAYNRNAVWGSEISLWEDVAGKSPQNPRAHNNLGDVYWAKGLTDKAAEQYELAVRIYPDYAEAHYNLGYVYRVRGLLDKAIEHYETAVRIEPDYTDAHNNLGSAYRAKGLLDKAIGHYKIALRLNPDYGAGVHYNLGNAYAVQGLTDKAEEQYRLAVKIDPDFADAHNNLGELYLKKKLMDKARKEFETALKINPDIQSARKRLEYIKSLLK